MWDIGERGRREAGAYCTLSGNYPSIKENTPGPSHMWHIGYVGHMGEESVGREHGVGSGSVEGQSLLLSPEEPPSPHPPTTS